MVISALAFLMARVPALTALGLSALTIAIVLGALFGNIEHRLVTGPRAQPGLQVAQKTFLRLGVALYGLNLSLPQILQVGPAAIVDCGPRAVMHSCWARSCLAISLWAAALPTGSFSVPSVPLLSSLPDKWCDGTSLREDSIRASYATSRRSKPL